MIKLEELRQILDMVREHDLAELELESDGQRLRIRKDAGHPAHAAAAPPPAAAPAPALAPVPAPPAPAPAELEAEAELAVVKSPIVGTFYRAPAPNAAPFAQPGDTVRKGQTLCIIEAMKMMNNIDSEYDGTLVKVYVENGQPVQYGERLFAIRTA
ncbi:MAG: accB [Acidobacteria bacterium]|nr:accB [Acidobacteriota bacterium]